MKTISFFLLLTILAFSASAQSGRETKQDSSAYSITINSAPSNEAVLQKLAVIEDNIGFWSLISNLLALFMVFTAGFLALVQVKANVIANARIQWNEKLRSAMGNFISTSFNINSSIKELKSMKNNSAKRNELHDKIRRDVFILNDKGNLALLYLIPDKHKNIIDRMEAVIRLIGKMEDNKVSGKTKLEIEIDFIINDLHKLFSDGWKSAKSTNIWNLLRGK